MNVYVTGTGEVFAEHAANTRLFAGVDTHVRLQMTGLHETLLAGGARVYGFSPV